MNHGRFNAPAKIIDKCQTALSAYMDQNFLLLLNFLCIDVYIPILVNNFLVEVVVRQPAELTLSAANPATVKPIATLRKGSEDNKPF